MDTTQLTCPHCGSTLTFGATVSEGMRVECLICMQTFNAVDPVVTTFPGGQIMAPLPPITLDAPLAADLIVESAPPAILPDLMVSATAIDDDAVPTVDTGDPVLRADQISCAPSPAISTNSLATAKRVSQGHVLISKPYSPPLPSAIADVSFPKATFAPVADRENPSVAVASAPALRRSQDPDRNWNVALLTATVGLLFLLTCGIVIAAWKVTSATRSGPVEAKILDDLSSKDLDTNTDSASTSYLSAGKKNDKPSPPLTPEEDDDLRNQIQDEVRQTLKRKVIFKRGGNEPDPDPIPVLNIAKQSIVGLDQQKINTAIEKGVAYLKQTQNAAGTWSNAHPVGYAAIGGLTLLECDAPPKDSAVQKAAVYVRTHTANLNATYDLSLAILFLDRLGDKRDRPLIQGMALRLLAGQQDSGGWTYSCPSLSPKSMYHLYTFLQSNKRPGLLNGLRGDLDTQAGIVVNPKRDPNRLDNPFQELNELILAMGIDGSKSKSKTAAQKDGLITPVSVNSKGPATIPKSAKPKMKSIPPESLPADLRTLPIVKNQGLKKGKMQKGRRGSGDNSNTQFALLALWAARRHDVPTDQALLASFERFMTSQNPDGGWGYLPGTGINPHTMTNVGLLGLAMGHGAAPDIIHYNPRNPKDTIVKPALQDPAIQKGLKALSRHVGQPTLDPAQSRFPMQNLYFLWSVERVAMLYDLKTIGGKDWYGWGAQSLVHTQGAAGDWTQSQYPGATAPVNTCFALLFLRRSNLVQDLTNHLRLSTGITDSEK